MSDPKDEASAETARGGGATGVPVKQGARRPLLFKTAAGGVPLATGTSRSTDPDEQGTDGDS